MTVRLIALTQPVDPADAPDSQALLAYFARVSSAANQGKHDTGARLIRRLIKHAEWSPLEMVSLTLEIVTTRDIARQMLRHRSFAFQEFSQRYSVVTSEPVLREARLQHPTDRQMSVETDDVDLRQEWSDVQAEVARHAETAYHWALGRGLAKEQARAVLPEGLTPSRLYMAGTLRSWFHYCELRRKPGTQLEHREIAEAAWNLVVAHYPILGEDGA